MSLTTDFRFQGLEKRMALRYTHCDGAPMGKDDTSCAWLVGFLNIGRGILSSSENYLLFGANCPENCIPVQRYVKMLMSDIQKIEKNSFQCTYTNSVGTVTVNVKCKIGELPNDMKMLAFLSGELGNSAKYFSSFANVSSDNANDVNASLKNFFAGFKHFAFCRVYMYHED